ncbi:MAG: YceI family protein [Hyphomicrobiales bacterium]
MGLLRSLVFRIAAPIVLLAIVAVAGWWFFIREDNEAQKEAAPVTDEVRAAASHTATATPSGEASVDADRPDADALSTFRGETYRILADQSSAWYLAPEKLASLQTSSTAKGTTTEISGEFHITGAGLDPEQQTTFVVGLSSLKSDQSRRDSRVQDALETSRYPTATFTATALTGLPAQLSPTEDAVMQLTGTLDLHGVQKEVTWELKAKQDGDILSVLATTSFKYSDFGIRKPDIAGFVSVEDEVTLQIQLYATKA